LIKIIIKEENFKWHLEAFASELFIYTHTRTHSYKQDQSTGEQCVCYDITVRCVECIYPQVNVMGRIRAQVSRIAPQHNTGLLAIWSDTCRS